MPDVADVPNMSECCGVNEYASECSRCRRMNINSPEGRHALYLEELSALIEILKRQGMDSRAHVLSDAFIVLGKLEEWEAERPARQRLLSDMRLRAEGAALCSSLLRQMLR